MAAHLTRLSIVAVCLALLGGLMLSQGRPARDSEFGPAKVRYDDYIKRPSLLMRTRGRIGLAQTRHIGAWEILTQSYARPEEPREQVKSLLSTIVAQNFMNEEWTDRWHDWRNRHKSSEDAWLWYRSLLLHHDNRDAEELLRVASEERELLIRAAALAALADSGAEEVLGWWTKELEKADDWRGFDRVIMLESAAHAFASLSRHLGEDSFREMGLKLIPLIENRHTHERTRLVMARHFRKAFDADALYIEARPWLHRLLNPEAESKDDGYARVPPTRFVGVEATGKRIAYVIDLSDSMLIPLTPGERDEIRRPPEPSGPVTGRDGDRDRPREPKDDEKESEDLEDQLPWDRIHTRFDAAREYLKLSLQTLTPDQYFCVIMFGTNAEFARSTRTLVQATPRNIRAAITELDRIRPGPATQVRTHGTLMGDTNLHGGMHRAFMVRTNGVVNGWSGIDQSTFLNGVDTIFLLSDGDPTDDDWAQRDRRDDFDQTGDPETGTRFEDQDYLRFPGPYGYMYSRTYLPDDIRRLNLFRRCEIHCIGIGEVTEGLLREIAYWGNGEVRFIGG
jgi:hypothetical protein